MHCRSILCAAALLVCSTWLVIPAGAAEDDGFTPIFNGQNLDGWSGDPKFWSVEDGAITVQCEFCSTAYRFDPAEIRR